MKDRKFAVLFFTTAFAVLCFVLAAGVFGLFGARRNGEVGLILLAVSFCTLMAARFYYRNKKRAFNYLNLAERRKPNMFNRYDLLGAGAVMSAVTAALVPSVRDLAGIVGRVPAPQIQIYVILRPLALVISLMCALWFFISAFANRVDNPNKSKKNGASSVLVFALFIFVVMIAENAYVMPLPDIALYVPRLFAFYSGAMFFINLCFYLYAPATRRLNNLALYSLTGTVFFFADLFLHIIYANPFKPRPVYTLVLSAAAGLYLLYYRLTFNLRLASKPKAETGGSDELFGSFDTWEEAKAAMDAEDAIEDGEDEEENEDGGGL